MAGNYAQLLDIINNPTDHSLPAWDNDNKLIEGLTIKQYLLTIIQSLTAGYQFMGVATPSTSPGTPDQNVFYIGGAGTYANFGTSITVRHGQICIFKWNGSWTNTQIEIAETGFLNVNDVNGRTTAYGNESAGRSAVPTAYRKCGLNITYFLSTGWVIELFVGDDVSDWGDSENWKTIGPIDVSQNNTTKHIDINIGNKKTSIPSVQEVELLTDDSIIPQWLYYVLESGYYYNGITEGSGGLWKRTKIIIKDCAELKFKTKLSGLGNCCITDENNNVLKSFIATDITEDGFVKVDLSLYAKAYYFYYSAFLYDFTENDIYIKGLSKVSSLIEFKELETYIKGYKEIETGELTNAIILAYNAPVVTSSPGYRLSGYIPVQPNDKIKVLSLCGDSGLVISGYASESQDSYISNCSVAGHTATEPEWFEIIIPTGVNYIRVSCSEQGLTNGTIPVMQYVADSVDERINKASGIQYISFNNPYLINLQAHLQSSGGTNYWCSDFIELEENVTYKIIGIKGSSGCLNISFYSSQDQDDFAGRGIYGVDVDETRDVVFTVPNGGKFVRFCGSWGITNPPALTLLMVNEGFRISNNENKLLASKKTLLDFPHTSSRKPMILFQLDGASAAYSKKLIDYADILFANGVKKSTYNVLPQYLGYDNYKNFDLWMNAIFDRGNEIALHTDNTYNLALNSTMTDAQVEAALKDYLDKLEAKGYNITGFIPLGAELKPSFKPIVAKYMNWMLSGDGTADVDLMAENAMDCISNLQTDRFEVLRIDLECTHTDASTEMHAQMLQRAKDIVDETILQGGYTIFYTHTYDQVFGTTYTLYPELFIPLCEYIKSKIDNRQIVSGNTNEMLEWYYTPRIGE